MTSTSLAGAAPVSEPPGPGAESPVVAPGQPDPEQRFLKLLVTQLKNQDPLNPLDNAQLTSQLAQMSTVSGIEKLNTAFQSMLAQTGASQVLQSASLIGRTVLVPGEALALRPEAAATPWGIDLPQAADQVTVSLADEQGKVVRSLTLGPQAAGVQTFTWDGRGTDQAPLPPGVYRMSVEARSGDTRIAATPLVPARVGSVSQGATGPMLELEAGARAGLSAVRLIL